MSKKLNTGTITNELSEGSAFFPSRQIAQQEERKPTPIPEKQQEVNTVMQKEQQNHDIPERVNARTPERSTTRRIITRNSFEIYEDQMESLRKLSYEEKMNGKLGSMSAMVREAIDDYLQKRALERKTSGK